MKFPLHLLLALAGATFAQAVEIQQRVHVHRHHSTEPKDPAPTVNSLDMAFVENFDNAKIDEKRWHVRSSQYFSVEQSVLTISSQGHHHKNLSTREKYDFGTIKARVMFGGEKDPAGDHYQRVGFAGAYLDTRDASKGSNTNSVHAVCRHGNEMKTSPRIPLEWGKFHDLRIDWDPDQIRFSINGKDVHTFPNTGMMEAQPIIIQNHRSYVMKLGSVEYASIDTTLSDELITEYNAMIDQLGDSSFKVRLAAQKTITGLLVKHGMRQLLRERFKNEEDLEIKLSIQDLLQ